MSRVANPRDQLILSWHTPRGGGGHRRLCPGTPTGPGGSGRTPTDEGKNQAWPGVGGEPPLVVMANTLKVRFVSVVGAFAGSVTTSGVEETTSGVRGNVVQAWGFRLTATGRKVSSEARRDHVKLCAGLLNAYGSLVLTSKNGYFRESGMLLTHASGALPHYALVVQGS